MTEYESLRRSFEHAVATQEEFKEQGREFALTLTNAFREFLGCSPETVVMQPVEADPREGRGSSPDEAVKLDGNGYFKFRITVSFGTSGWASLPVSFHKGKAPQGNVPRWQVKLIRDSFEGEVYEDLSGSKDLFRRWVGEARAAYDSALARYLSAGSPGSVEIGFKLGRS